jgi:hypothetical protein
MTTQPELTPKQLAVLEALLTCPTQEAAAKKAGVDASTIRRWLKEPAFAKAYRDARQTLADTVLSGLQAISAEAVTSLHAEMTNPLAKPAERIAASRAVLEFTLKTADALLIDERLGAIEMALSVLREAKKQ